MEWGSGKGRGGGTQISLRHVDTEADRSMAEFSAMLVTREPDLFFFKCCFTSTETAGTISDGGAQEGHLHFHTAPEP